MGVKPRGCVAAKQTSRVSSETIEQILELLQTIWGHATCELDHQNAYQLLVATILSAQSTDRRVNMVTPELFRRYPSPRELATADPQELETLVHSTGFYRQKAKNLRLMAQRVTSEYGGEIPRNMDDLVSLPGVARKTANVVLGTVFRIADGVVVDTHVKRLANRLGFTEESKPEKIERDLMERIPRDRWIDAAHQLIWHGRRVCHAKKPDCQHCALAPLCPSAEL